MSTGIRLVLPGGASSRLTRFVALSFAVHVIGTLAVVFIPQLGPAPTINEQAWAVELVSAAPPSRAVATPPQRAAPEPAPVETIPEPAPVRPKPEPPREVAIDRPAPRREPAPAPTPTPVATDEPATGPASDTSPGAPGGHSGPVGAGDESASVTALEVADFRYAWYRDAVTAKLYGNWRKPVLAGSVGPREVRVSFEIGRDGSVGRMRVETPSGLASLDRSALRAVADAAPFPPLPGGWSKSVLPASFVFRLFPD